jgi:RNA polymerase sigma factor (sigma-70 family)
LFSRASGGDKKGKGDDSRELRNILPSAREWILTKAAFDKLLANLDVEPDLAAERYEELRRMLVKFFEWRGTSYPEECADETLNRVARRIDEGLIIQNISGYCYGIARLVFLEWAKEPDRKGVSLDELTPARAALDGAVEENLELECFEECLRTLPADSREVIVQYYGEEKRAMIDHRRQLAESLGIPLNALRSRAQRIRQKLEQCIVECLKPKS